MAKEAGVTGKSIDMTGIQDVRQVIEDHAIFGRVTPEQKKEMIIALKEKGHTVAMTGDGVNDVMALKKRIAQLLWALAVKQPRKSHL